MIAIIDYGTGNLGSVYNAFQFLGLEARIASRPEQLRDMLGIVLPGVGAFGDGMRKLRERGFEELEAQVLRNRKPFLGICLGLQLLATMHQIIGNPIHEVERFNQRTVDELIYLDITSDDLYDLRRDDPKARPSRVERGIEDKGSVVGAVR